MNEQAHLHLPPRRRKVVRTLFSFALLLLVLGCANIVFGYIKAREYENLLLEASREREDQEELLAPAISLESKQELQVRLEYYEFVVSGGRWILGFAGVFLLLTLINLRDSPDRLDKANLEG